ncbi:GNAT family N-acetyltransferase [uncultured Ruegeria sp.]|uniref:GNAT family N-acetyltransferase n=1 Tax=uncultured Ruegeria sp. TaxID=259304 RepID=UPI00262B306B|nr:GNAT family N-acetyltransferase [uncultured Ruegeria sp.]
MSSSLSFRYAETTDAPAIARLMNHMGFDHSAQEIERRWNLIGCHEQDHLLLALEGLVPVGAVAVHIAPLLFYPQPLARITTLVVDSSKRRQGIGKALVNEAISLARKSDCDTIELTTGLARDEAHAFYRSIGFQNSALRMSRRL